MAYELTHVQIAASGQKRCFGICYDGVGSIFSTVRDENTCVEVRASDGAYLDAAGATTTRAGATFSVGSTPYGVLANAQYVWVLHGSTSYIKRYNRATRANDYTISNYWGTGNTGSKWVSIGNYFYFYCSNYPLGNPGVIRIDPATGASTYKDLTGTVSGGTTQLQLKTDGTHLITIGDGVGQDLGYLRILDATTMNQIAAYQPAGASVNLYGCAWDNGSNVVVYDAATTGFRLVQISDGTVVSSTSAIYPSNILPSVPTFLFVDPSTSGTSSLLWAGQSGSTSPGMARFRWPDNGTADLTVVWTGGTNCGAFDGQNLWLARSEATPTEIVQVANVLVPDVVPNLTAVDPGTGPTLTLTFDASVSATATTVGSPADGVGVTAVSPVDSTTIDLDLAVRPDHPSGSADYNTLQPPGGWGARVT